MTSPTLILATIVLPGVFRTAWIGDSNSAPLGVTKPPAILATLQPTVDLDGQTFDAAWDNYAQIGATACGDADGFPRGMDQLATALRSNPHLVVVALGTNDLVLHTAKEIASCLAAICAAAIGPDGHRLPCWIVTLPPLPRSLRRSFDVPAVNRAIVAHFGADRVIGGYRGMRLLPTANGTPPNIHIDAASEVLRARRVAHRFRP